VNIFRVLASGRAPFKEEAASAFLAYLLSPKMDHGLGPNVLAGLLKAVGEAEKIRELVTLADQLDTRLREDLFGTPDSVPSVAVTLEQAYSADKNGFIDVVVLCGGWFIAIENKLNPAAYRHGQVGEQYRGLRERSARREVFREHRLLMLYLVPAQSNPDDTWSVPKSAQGEVSFSTAEGDLAAVITWQPTQERASIVGVLRKILQQESVGEIPPMSTEVRQSLLALIDFALGEFQGFPYESAIVMRRAPDKRVQDLLTSPDQGYVGVQYGMAGVIRQAWRNSAFADALVQFSESPRGWQYVPLSDFRILAQWAMNPDQPLEGITWEGKPFATPILYLVAKAAGPRISIGIRGGLAALDAMSAEEIRTRKGWELADEARNTQWFSGTDFCRVLERKGVKYDSPAE
jgi:hypothetical protein